LHVNCNGGGNFYGRYFKCWVLAEHRVHGGVDISKAIYQSCDVFFYTLAQRLGIERIAKWASAFGLGKKTGIDLPNEVSGTMPSEEWKIKNYRQKWIISETISVGIGQGAVTTTPIQLAHAIGGISMAGALYRPHVVAPDQLTPQFKETSGGDYNATHVPLDPQNWITITDAMAGVVNPGGTANSAHLQGIDFAGKTGSAQVISNDLRKSKGGSGKEFKDNGWFAGVAPRRNPEIVVAVLLEQGEHGYLAARIASQVIKAYVDKQRRLHNNPTLFSDKADPGSIPVAGVWSYPQANDGTADGQNESEGDDHHLLSGTLLVKSGKQDRSVRKKSARALASVLPGMAR
jgi:penicillin-binding protein 2